MAKEVGNADALQPACNGVSVKTPDLAHMIWKQRPIATHCKQQSKQLVQVFWFYNHCTQSTAKDSAKAEHGHKAKYQGTDRFLEKSCR